MNRAVGELLAGWRERLTAKQESDDWAEAQRIYREQKERLRPTPERQARPTPERQARPTPERQARPTPERQARPTPERQARPTISTPIGATSPRGRPRYIQVTQQQLAAAVERASASAHPGAYLRVLMTLAANVKHNSRVADLSLPEIAERADVHRATASAVLGELVRDRWLLSVRHPRGLQIELHPGLVWLGDADARAKALKAWSDAARKRK